jgi:hypothetical protein
MENAWQFQLRITVSEELATSLRGDPSSRVYAPLGEVLRKHHASLKCLRLTRFDGQICI